MRFRSHLLEAVVVALLVVPTAAHGISGVWEILAPNPVPRTEVAAVALEGKIWVLGGLGPNAAAGRLVHVYDPVTNTWSDGPTLPIAVHHTGVVGIGSRLFVLGGYTGQSFSPTALTWQLDTSLPPEAQAWLPFVPLPLPRGAHVAASDGSNIWIFGGVGPFGLESRAFVMPGLLDAPLLAWVPIADFPDTRDHLAGTYFDGKVYAVGGRDLNLATNTGRLDVYDPLADTWTQAASMPAPRGGIAADHSRGHVFVFGGESLQGTFNTVEAYNPLTNSWHSISPMPTARHGIGAALIGNSIYVEAGGPQPGLTFTGANEVLRAFP